MRKLVTVLSLALILCLAIGSVIFAQEKVTLRFSWWGGDSRHRATVKAIERYMELNPHVTIKAEYAGWDGYHDKLTTQHAANNAPDISQLSISSVAEYASRGLILDVTDMKDTIFADLDESLWDGFRDEQGAFWGIPLGTNCVSYHYNRRMFSDFGLAEPTPGWTWDDVFSIAQKATRDLDGDGRTDVFGTSSLFVPSTDSMHVISYQWGGSLYRNNYTEPNIDGGSMETYLNLAKKFQDAGVTPSPEETVVYTGSQSDFNQGRAAMTAGMLSGIELNQSLMEDEVVNIHWPIAAETGLTGTFLKPSQAIVINSRTKHRDEVVKFLDWLLTSPEAALITTFERGVPSSRGQRDALIAADITELQRNIVRWTNQSADYADSTSELTIPGQLEMLTALLETFEEAQYEVLSIPATVQKMQRRAAEILKRYK